MQCRESCREMGVGWDLVPLSTQGEHDYILYMLEKRRDFRYGWTLHIGPIKRNDQWMEGSLENADKISFDFRWHQGESNKNTEDQCMVLIKTDTGKVEAKISNCDDYHEFICSHVEYLE